MALSRHSSRIYMDEEDVKYVQKILDELGDVESESGNDFRCGVLRGAAMVFRLLEAHSEIREPSTFSDILLNMLNESTE